MAPRRKVSARASTEESEEASQPKAKQQRKERTRSRGGSGGPGPPARQWTDEEETLLLRHIVRLKPVGMHKHFRMRAILEILQTANLAPLPGEAPITNHDVWAKLEDLYDLEALDEREDGIDFLPLPNATEEPFVDFALPDDEYKDVTFARRLAPGGTSSPPLLPFQMAGGPSVPSFRQSTIDDSEDLRSSPASIKGQGATGRGSSRGGGRASSHLAAPPLAPARPTRRGGRASRASVETGIDEDGGAGQEVREDTMDVDDEESKDESKAKGGERSTRRSARKK